MSDPVTHHVISYGGGVNSTAMILHLLTLDTPIDHIVFIDTGAEFTSTLDYVSYFAAHIGKSITVIRHHESLYDYCYARRKIPSLRYRWCTTTFKRRVFARWMRTQIPRKERIIEYIGFDAGEDSRVANALSMCHPKSRKVTRYPLFFAGIDRDDCKALIATAGLMMPSKSGCYICPYQSKTTMRSMLTEHPIEFARALELERVNKYHMSIRQGLRLIDVATDAASVDMSCDYEPSIPCQCYDAQDDM